jgi:hypothetical protein
MVEVLTSCLTLVHTVATDTMNDGTVAWTASAATTPAGGRYFIRVAATDGGNGGNHVAFSDSGEFDILAPTPTLSLVSIFDANEGGVWEKGSTEVVRFASTHGADQSGIHVLLLGCDVANDPLCASPTSTRELTDPAHLPGSATGEGGAGRTFFEWKVPTTSPPQAKAWFVVQLQSSSYAQLTATSNRFQVVDPSCPLHNEEGSGNGNAGATGGACADDRVFTVVSPSSATVAPLGSVLTVAWTVVGANKHPDWTERGVEITLRDGTTHQLIAVIVADTPNTGSYEYVLPDSLLSGKYVVQVLPVDQTGQTNVKRIQCPASSVGTRCRSGLFSVNVVIGLDPTLAVSITETLWTVGTVHRIEWEGRQLHGAFVSIYVVSLPPSKAVTDEEAFVPVEVLVLDNGLSSGRLQWEVTASLVPSYPNKNYVVEARCNAPGSVKVLSQSVPFAVAAASSLSMITPTSSVKYVKGSTYEISWVYTGVPFDLVARLYEGATGRQTVSGDACMFPFTYLGIHYDYCVRGGGYGVGYSEWCPTDVIGANRDAANREQCAPMTLVGQLNPYDNTLVSAGTAIESYDVALLRFRWSIDEESIPGPGNHYYIELSSSGGGGGSGGSGGSDTIGGPMGNLVARR